MEYNIQKYNFFQNGKDYVVSTGLVGDRIRITCQENLSLDGPFYCNEFTLYDLRVANQFFNLTQSPVEALNEINKGIERQKSALKPGINDTMLFIGYLVIGTDNDIYNLILKRDFDPNRYGVFTPPKSNAVDLVLTTNYQVDGERLLMAEKRAGDLQREQTFIEEELNKTIPEINKLKKITIDIEEENALIRERIKILQKQLEQRKYNVIRLKEENMNLKRENLNLNNRIKNQEDVIRNKQAIQTNVKVPERRNIYPGQSAVTSKFEQTALRTFLPRTGAKPTTDEYPKNINYTTTIPVTPTQIITNTDVYDNVETQYLQPIYQQPQIIQQQPQIIQQQPQPIILKVEQPIITISPQKQLRSSNYSISSHNSYKNPTYRAYLTSPKNVIYKNRVNPPNNYKNLSNNQNNNKDVPYSSSGVANNKDVPYSSSGKAINKDAPYSSSGMTNLNTNNVPYTNRTGQNELVTLNDKIMYNNPYSGGTSQNKLITLNDKIMHKSNPNRDINNGQISNKLKNEGYTSINGVGNPNINTNNAGYNSQMANIQGNSLNYSKPVGSRLPQANLGNYSGKLFGSNNNSQKRNNSQTKDSKDSLIIGYSSYQPEKK